MSAGVRTFRWGLALAGGLLTELGLFVVLVIAYPFGTEAPLYAIPPASLVITFVAGAWVARRVTSRHVLHGLAVGIVAAAIYIVLTIGQTLPLAYVATHFLKLLGGASGGWVVRRRTLRVVGAVDGEHHRF